VATNAVVQLDEAGAGLGPPGSTGCHRFRASPREIEILLLIADGRPDKWIARQLGISPHTVRSHLDRLFMKNNVHTRGAAIAAWYAKRAED
jgi:DNA-binding CsgD family transcriptional regulator